MENMSWEILEALKEYYGDDEELLATCLFYLLNISSDKALNRQIEDIMEDLDYCSYCGTKLETVTIEEHHTELDGNPIEYLFEVHCPKCD